MPPKPNAIPDSETFALNVEYTHDHTWKANSRELRLAHHPGQEMTPSSSQARPQYQPANLVEFGSHTAFAGTSHPWAELPYNLVSSTPSSIASMPAPPNDSVTPLIPHSPNALAVSLAEIESDFQRVQARIRGLLTSDQSLLSQPYSLSSTSSTHDLQPFIQRLAAQVHELHRCLQRAGEYLAQEPSPHMHSDSHGPSQSPVGVQASLSAPQHPSMRVYVDRRTIDRSFHDTSVPTTPSSGSCPSMDTPDTNASSLPSPIRLNITSIDTMRKHMAHVVPDLSTDRFSAFDAEERSGLTNDNQQSRGGSRVASMARSPAQSRAQESSPSSFVFDPFSMEDHQSRTSEASTSPTEGGGHSSGSSSGETVSRRNHSISHPQRVAHHSEHSRHAPSFSLGATGLPPLHLSPSFAVEARSLPPLLPNTTAAHSPLALRQRGNSTAALPLLSSPSISARTSPMYAEGRSRLPPSPFAISPPHGSPFSGGSAISPLRLQQHLPRAGPQPVQRTPPPATHSRTLLHEDAARLQRSNPSTASFNSIGDSPRTGATHLRPHFPPMTSTVPGARSSASHTTHNQPAPLVNRTTHMANPTRNDPPPVWYTYWTKNPNQVPSLGIRAEALRMTDIEARLLIIRRQPPGRKLGISENSPLRGYVSLHVENPDFFMRNLFLMMTMRLFRRSGAGESTYVQALDKMNVQESLADPFTIVQAFDSENLPLTDNNLIHHLVRTGLTRSIVKSLLEPWATHYCQQSPEREYLQTLAEAERSYYQRML